MGLDDALVDRHAKHGDFINKVFGDEAVGAYFREMMLDLVCGRLREVGEYCPEPAPNGGVWANAA